MTAEWPTVEPGPGDTVVIEQRESPVVRRPGLPTVALVPITGLVWWVIGFLPWILSGLTYGPGGTRSALPLVGADLSPVVIGGGLGGLAAGAVVLLDRGPWVRRLVAVVGGVATAAIITLLQSLAVLRNPVPGNFSTADRVLAGLSLTLVVMTLVGVAWGLLVLAGPVGQGLTLAGAAGALPVWTSTVLDLLGVERQSDLLHSGAVVRWLGAALLAAGLVRIGLRPAARLAWWPVAVVLAWIVGPTVTASGYLSGALRPGTPSSELLDFYVPAAWQVWKAAGTLEARPLTPWIAAIAVAAVVAFAVDRLHQRRVEQPVP